MSEAQTIRARAIRHLLTTLLFLSVAAIVPGGLRFWPAWWLIGLIAAFWAAFLAYFVARDPALLERRLQTHETEPQQRIVQKLYVALVPAGLIVSGFDFRFGWSRAIGVPLALIVAGQIATVAGYCFVFWVMKTNSFAASTIRVEDGQTVIRTGPYGIVRHPMYLGMALTAVGMPLALASYVALPVLALVVPLLVYRLVHEERKLRRDLPGYAEYCGSTRFRLVPGLW